MSAARAWALLCAGVALVGCDRLNGHGTLRLSGTLELTEHSVGARVAGRLETLLVDEGTVVTRGQVIAILDRADQAQREYDRLRALFEQGGAARQAVEQAGLALDDQRMVSPVDGVVLVKVREAGEVVAAGSPVVVIGDRRALWVRVFVPEGVINRIAVGAPAVVRFDGLRRSVQGHVSFVAPRAEFTPRNVQTPEERITQTFAVKVAVDGAEPSLRPGVAAEVTIHVNGGSP